MPVKYSCPKCGRRFAEWGAEKYGFKCPGDEWCPADRPEVIELVRVGMQEDAKPAKKPTLKRPVKRAAATVSTMDDDELLVPDIEEIDGDSDVDDDGDDVEDEDDDVVAVSSVVESTDDVTTDDSSEELDEEDGDDFVGDDGVVDDSLEDADDIVEEEWKD
ncbi:MAG: hypothetical protein KJ060_18495 [Candidatus Hydrogenedentes bacterium]|nr:hypothetical protein [Candidatus Hydrogenedentota bacterium]